MNTGAGPILVEIDGQPVAKARARGGRFGHYTPKKTGNYEAWVKHCAVAAMSGRERVECPVTCNIVFFMDIPASWPAWRREAASRGMIAPSSRPDIDNFIKSIFDGFNSIVWKDDGQVSRVTAEKRYAEASKVVVTVNPINQIGSSSEWKQWLADDLDV